MTPRRSRHVWPSLALGVAALWAGSATSVDGPTTAPATTPATLPAAPADHPEVDRLLPDLSSEDWRVRQQAVARLAALGEPAEPRLSEFARTTGSDEARDRAQVALQQIAGLRRLGPTRVTLRLDAARPQDAFAELARQAGVQFATRPRSLWRDRDYAPVTVDLRGVPFWEAVRVLCAPREIQPSVDEAEPGGPPRFALAPDLTGEMTSPRAMAGSFMVVVTKLARTRAIDPAAAADADLMLRIYADPKWRIIEYPQHVAINAVADAAGNPLPRPDPMGMQSFKDRFAIWTMRGTLRKVPAGATKLGRLAGSFRVTVLEQSELAEIPDVMRASNVVSRTGGQSLQLAGIARDPQDRQQYRARLILTRPGGSAGAQEWQAGAGAEGIQLLDDRGRAYRRAVTDSQDHGAQTTLDLTFMAAGQPDLGPPAKLVWRVPLDTRELTVPFEFGEVPFSQ